jgi:hypothetical protein
MSSENQITGPNAAPMVALHAGTHEERRDARAGQGEPESARRPRKASVTY